MALYDDVLRGAVRLEGLKSWHATRVQKFLIRVAKETRLMLLEGDTETAKRRRELLSAISKYLNQEYAAYGGELETGLVDLGVFESKRELASISAIEGIAATPFRHVLPAPEQVKAAIFSAPFQAKDLEGKLLQPYIEEWSTHQRSRTLGFIRQGFFRGDTTQQIAKQVLGYMPGTKDRIPKKALREATAVVRTAIQHASTISRLETIKSNGDIIDRYGLVATLDSRTTTLCRSLDGKTYPVGKGPLPPFHVACRTTTIPILIDKYAYLSEDRTRASNMPVGRGQIDAELTYYDALKKQPKWFQDEALGKTRAKLFRDGGITAEEFSKLNLDRNFRVRTIDEMYELNREAFERAGIAV